MLISKNAKTLRYPTRNPNASQWNIGCIGSQKQNSGFGHVHFMCFVLISFALGSQREPLFQWNMGLCFLALGMLVESPLGLLCKDVIDA